VTSAIPTSVDSVSRPLYLRFVDVYDAVEHLVEVMGQGAHNDSRFAVRKAVT
jgi:kynureninase